MEPKGYMMGWVLLLAAVILHQSQAAVVRYQPSGQWTSDLMELLYPGGARDHAQTPRTVYSNDPQPCNEDVGESMMCWACHRASSEEECHKFGYWSDCPGVSRCYVEHGYNANHGKSWVSRGCQDFYQCENFHFSGAKSPCNPKSYDCSYCTYGIHGHDFQCVDVAQLQRHVPRVYANETACEEEHSGWWVQDGNLACFTCRNQKGDQACLEKGKWEVCHQDDAVCQYKAHINKIGEVGQVFRQCLRREDCHNEELSLEDACDKNVNSSICKYCGYGIRKVEFDCVKPVCNASWGEGLMCFTCHNASTEEVCRAEGEWQACRYKNPRCEHETVKDKDGHVLSVSQYCQELEECTYYEEDPGLECERQGDNNVCRNCTLGEAGVDHKCSRLRDEEPCAIHDGQSLMCWTCYDAKDEEVCEDRGYWHACWQDHPWCHVLYDEGKDGKWANITRTCYEDEHCRSRGPNEEHFCENIKDGRKECRHCEFDTWGEDHTCHDASLLQAHHPRVYSNDWPCGNNNTNFTQGLEYENKKRLACWRCLNETSDAACLENGEWEVCCQQNAQCEYEVSMDSLGEVVNVTRRCQRDEACINHELDHTDVCDKHEADTTCKYCSFGVDRVEFMCTDNSTSCGSGTPGGGPVDGAPHLQTITQYVCPEYDQTVPCPPRFDPLEFRCFYDKECAQQGKEARCCPGVCKSECVDKEKLDLVTVCVPFGVKDERKFKKGEMFEANGYSCMCGEFGPVDCHPCDGVEKQEKLDIDYNGEIMDEDQFALMQAENRFGKKAVGSHKLPSLAEAIAAIKELGRRPKMTHEEQKVYDELDDLFNVGRLKTYTKFPKPHKQKENKGYLNDVLEALGAMGGKQEAREEKVPAWKLAKEMQARGQDWKHAGLTGDDSGMMDGEDKSESSINDRQPDYRPGVFPNPIIGQEIPHRTDQGGELPNYRQTGGVPYPFPPKKVPQPSLEEALKNLAGANPFGKKKVPQFYDQNNKMPGFPANSYARQQQPRTSIEDALRNLAGSVRRQEEENDLAKAIEALKHIGGSAQTRGVFSKRGRMTKS